MLQLFHTLLGIGKLFLEHFSHILILLLFLLIVLILIVFLIFVFLFVFLSGKRIGPLGTVFHKAYGA